jgi:hypothetical protein
MLTFLVLLCVALFLGALLGAAWDLSITDFLPARRVPARVRVRVPHQEPDRFASRGSWPETGNWTDAPWNDPFRIDSPSPRLFD